MDNLIQTLIKQANELAAGVETYVLLRSSTGDTVYPATYPEGQQVALSALLDWLIRQPETLCLNDQDEIQKLNGQSTVACALLAVPIRHQEEIIGVFECLSTQQSFDKVHQIAVQALAGQLQAVLEARATQETQVHYHELAKLTTSDLAPEPFYAQLTQQLMQLFQADACFITLWDASLRQSRLLIASTPELQQTFAAAGQDDPWQIQAVLKSRQPLFFRAEEKQPKTLANLTKSLGFQALVGLPLLARGHGIGTLYFIRQTPFTTEQLEPHTAAINQLALAIDNRNLQADTLNRLQETNSLLEIAAIAAAATDFQTMLKQVLELCRQVLEVEAGAILLIDRSTAHLRYLRGSGAFGFIPETRTFEIAAGDKEATLAKVFREGQPEFINPPNLIDPRWNEALLSGKAHNLLIAPIRVHDDPLGVFIVANKKTDFTFNDAGLLLAMSSHVAAAVRNAELLDDTRLRLSETEILQRIAAITSANVDLDDMLAVAMQETAHFFQAGGGQMLILTPNNRFLSLHSPSRFGVTTTWQIPQQPTPAELGVFNHSLPYIGEYTADNGDIYQQLSVPLNTQQGVIGVLSLYRQKPHFTPPNSELAIALASQIAIGLQSLHLFAQERQRADLMLLINRIAQDLSATLDLRSLMRKVVSNVHDALGYNIVYIFLLDDNGQDLVCQAAISMESQPALDVGFKSHLSKGLVGRAVRNRESILVGKVQDEADYLQWAGHDQIKSALVIPLRHGNSVYGALELLGTEENRFTDTDRMAMESLTSQVSIAIDNARLYNQAQRRLLEQGIVHQIGQDLTAILSYNDLVHAVVRHMTRALDTSSCTVALYDSSRERVRVEATYHLPGTEKVESNLKMGNFYNLSKFHAIRQAIETRRPVTTYLEDDKSDPKQVTQLQQDQALSELLIPMTVGKRMIGVVRWAENRRPRRFSRDDERLAQTLISQAAIAIENARLFREAERRAHEQYMLSQVTISLTAATTVEELVESFTIQTHNALEATNTVVSMVEDRQWHIRSHILTTRELEKTVLGQMDAKPNHESEIRHTLEMGESLFITPGHITQHASQLELMFLSQGTSSIALVPIIYRGDLIGVVEVSTDAPAVFDSEAVDLLEALANQAAVAIDNVRLSEREQRRLRRVVRIQNSNRRISSELNLQNLLKMVVEESSAIFEIPAVAILLPDKYNLNYVIHSAHGLSEEFLAAHHLSIEHRSADIEAMTDEERRKPRYYPKLIEAPHIHEHDQPLIKAEGLISCLSVPLVKGTKMAGMLNLYSREFPYRFSDDDLDLAQLFASQIAVAIDNAALYLAAQERARELAEANRLKSQFLANISHELRTPMNIILGFSETIMSGLYGELNERQYARLELIHRNAKNLRALIDDLLDISKIDAGKMEMALEAVNLVDELQAILQNLENQTQTKGIYLKLELPTGSVPLVYADALRLRQITTNLLGNAVKFTKEGGVTVRAEPKQEVVLAPKEGEAPFQEVVWVSITDTGIGISLEDQLIIFDEFRQADGSTTREFGGTGLGLAICKRLIELMGGRIWVDSEAGKGSTFTFVIPAAPAN